MPRSFPVRLCVLLSSLLAGCGQVTSTAVDGGVEDDAAVTPRFTVSVARTGNGNGTIAAAAVAIDCGNACSAQVAQGTAVTFTASAAPGSRFMGWTGGGCSGTGPCTVTVAADVSVSAAFVLEGTVMVTLAGDGMGRVQSAPDGIDCGADCDQAYPAGTAVTLTAAAAQGSSFGGWSGACAGMGTCTVSADGARMVTATFTRDRFALSVGRIGTGTGTVRSTPGGIACGADCDEVYPSGTQVTLGATADPGAVFEGWTGGGCSGTGPCTVTVTAASSVTASFSRRCDAFDRPDGTAVAGWTERISDWIIENNRVRSTSAAPAYTSHMTMDGSSQADGCVRFTAIHNGTVGGVQVVGGVLRWTANNSYLVGVVQDNSSTGNFNSIWIYEYPSASSIGAPLTGLTLGTSPNVEVCVVGNAVTVRADAARDGTYEVTATGTTTLSAAGLSGLATYTGGGALPYVDDFCWGP